ncbi:MAG: beta-ketoacyl-ACP reductase [Candidatus Portnoybacteria bacterium CG_4_9_14_3_um_filter_40_10]|uniref:Beta-ketoacyl-ACP reductase n=1 Tax=Candidatus Portnoybacteria bacterium CG_4_9_14_3_um_filter_40_10 TaxID=1974804 RepID=A0A2M7YN00_9BACT|nr:MAG: beta-ketoacyl-ACP reductase [Candidatus Portnoybacteria bacterium CG_4_9_14_3_um_filter_40_10]
MKGAVRYRESLREKMSVAGLNLNICLKKTVMPLKGLKGKTAIITGAARGIGQATTLRLAEEGANLGLIDRMELDSTMKKLKKFPVQVMSCRVDIRKYQKVKNFFNSVNRQFGHIDILVNNAGVYERKLVPDISSKYWDKILDNNLKSAFFCSQLAAPYMIKQGWGRIIFISSVSPYVAGKSSLAYNVSKAGLFGMNRSLAAFLAPHNINVNTLLVGIVETEMIKIIPLPRLQNLKENSLLKRFAQPGEIASAIAFLASEESSFMTGAVINVSGGLIS